MTRFQYLTLGYSLIWLALAVYLFSMHRTLTRLRADLDELRRGRRPDVR